MRLPPTRVHNIDLLSANFLSRYVRVVEFDYAWLKAMLRAWTTHIQQDSAVRFLHLVTVEYGHIQVPVFEELKQLLSNDNIVVAGEGFTHLVHLLFSYLYEARVW